MTTIKGCKKEYTTKLAMVLIEWSTSILCLRNPDINGAVELLDETTQIDDKNIVIFFIKQDFIMYKIVSSTSN